MAQTQPWPVLNYTAWKDTLATLHLWTQIVGKIRLRKMPWLNHSWHVTLYVNPEGLGTGSMPYQHGIFSIDFNFVEHALVVVTSAGGKEKLPLKPMTVADFYQKLFELLYQMDIDVSITDMPSEIPGAIPFSSDTVHHAYDAAQVRDFWSAMVQVHSVFTRFRTGFIGKASPVHFFWGAFDMAVTRFSGRRAPAHNGQMPNMPKLVMQEAYSHEVSSCGFWLGSDQYPHAVFYSYCYPTPDDFSQQPIKPAAAFFSQEMGEFMLNYEDVQQSEDPAATLLDFLRTTYEAAANTANWDRRQLECDLSLYENTYGCYKES
ncbi:MAG: hypothetical protein JO154_13880 [Chitinophaga sp.]|uniref:DUF5996 family protein n=1 Tax=Chitinophaga sp. TaxID=1869181 RepID=UPI0025BE94E9|nr:DUF5996 family protein [Chitinophaga sp.]MBV8253693.1 hypothetical protein [Chitinophaga sp.]